MNKTHGFVVASLLVLASLLGLSGTAQAAPAQPSNVYLYFGQIYDIATNQSHYGFSSTAYSPKEDKFDSCNPADCGRIVRHRTSSGRVYFIVRTKSVQQLNNAFFVYTAKDGSSLYRPWSGHGRLYKSRTVTFAGQRIRVHLSSINVALYDPRYGDLPPAATCDTNNHCK